MENELLQNKIERLENGGLYHHGGRGDEPEQLVLHAKTLHPGPGLPCLAFATLYHLLAAPQLRKLVIAKLHNMETIENQDGAREILENGGNVSRRHIRDHGLQPDFGTFAPLPSRGKSVSAFALTNINHVAPFQVEDHGQRAMSFAEGDFINGNLRSAFVYL